MSGQPHVEQIINNATFNATVTGGTITNDKALWSVVAQVGAITGTPVLKITVNVSVDGSTWYPAYVDATGLTAANAKERIVFGGAGSIVPAGIAVQPPIVEPFIQVVATLTSTTSFANTSVWLIGMGGYD